eukprot:CAMPEP_0197494274 /NCGR_PEP_ID=MMETSP1311-20131121/28576_1 /TAXON_ID=464262 /ORGANISM="Genus nov. species nov., Strain RCC856" /LENGTH=88 /DNA_ID=CAMNT_0043039637 /DNA_START=18 /DNA_END=280 /DNA_ORIENTATION=+
MAPPSARGERVAAAAATSTAPAPPAEDEEASPKVMLDEVRANLERYADLQEPFTVVFNRLGEAYARLRLVKEGEGRAKGALAERLGAA